MSRRLSRLEKLYFRLEAQTACLAWAFGQIADKPGVVFEIGLGHGRTYDHLRLHLPERQIYVFDRQVDSYPECTPPEEQIILGELLDTLPKAAIRLQKQVILAHSDVGSFSQEGNVTMSRLVSSNLGPALADGALIISDLPLEIAGATALPLPSGAKEGRYYLYRYHDNAQVAQT